MSEFDTIQELNEIAKDTTYIIWKDRKRIWCGLPWTFTVYKLTSDRIFIKSGIFNIVEEEVRLYRIKDTTLKRNLIQRIFGLGNIYVCSNDSSLKNFTLINIKNSSEIREKISELVEEERQKKRVYSREFMVDDSEDAN